MFGGFRGAVIGLAVNPLTGLVLGSMIVQRLIGDEGDGMSAQDPGIFWYQVKLTLRSPLTPQEAREQLSKALPHFDLATGCPVPRLGLFIPRGRIFDMEVSEGAFRVSGPLYRSKGSVASAGGLDVDGRIEPDEQGSLIHLTALNSGGVLIAVLFGLLIFVALPVCVVVVNFYPAIILAVPLSLIGIILYLYFSSRSRRALKPAVLCLQKMLRAQRTL